MGPRGVPTCVSRAGRIPAWLPLGVVLVGILALLARLEEEAQARGVARIETARYRLHTGERWCSPAWTARLERLLLDAQGLLIGDREGIEALVAEKVNKRPQLRIRLVRDPQRVQRDERAARLRAHVPVCTRVERVAAASQ